MPEKLQQSATRAQRERSVAQRKTRPAGGAVQRLQQTIGNRGVGRVVQRMSAKERDELNSSDYDGVRFNKVTGSGYHLFTILKKGGASQAYYNIQVHWHPVSDKFPQESWTVRWANEGSGNVTALEWMKDLVRATPEAVKVALASQSSTGGSGAEYQAQFPSLSEASKG